LHDVTAPDGHRDCNWDLTYPNLKTSRREKTAGNKLDRKNYGKREETADFVI
jgi:hypothetical protein